MATARVKAARYTTPKGTFVYPYLTRPDYGRGNFANTAGIYKVNLRMTLEEAEPLLKVLQPLYDQTLADGEASFANLDIKARKKMGKITPTPLYEEEYDTETEQPTGEITFKFATKASGVNQKGEAWTRTIPLFTPAGKTYKPSMVGGGTIGKVTYEVSPYFIPASGVTGVKLYLVAAQILELSEGSSGTSSQYGFAKEEGYEEPEEEESTTDSDDDDSGTDDDNF
jgi:hypothetical protein|tara:strand:+ start:13202 stop:13879 length:678 start_codon:yes stop_codon:yes gene_type:complete